MKMKTRTKVLLTILLAVFYFVFIQKCTQHASADLPDHLDQWYAGYNETYFNNELPKDVAIDWGEHNPRFMASTMLMSSGKFHIGFNEDYARGARVAHILLLHEMCHQQTWNEYDGENEITHGPLWRACMLRLDHEGAFRKELIDGLQ